MKKQWYKPKSWGYLHNLQKFWGLDCCYTQMKIADAIFIKKVT